MSRERNPSRIVCAAIKLKTGEVLVGIRHFDAFMLRQINERKLDKRDAVQGFVDQYGSFFTRTEAWKIADAQGQIMRPTGWEEFSTPRTANIGDAGLLFSENLY